MGSGQLDWHAVRQRNKATMRTGGSNVGGNQGGDLHCSLTFVPKSQCDRGQSSHLISEPEFPHLSPVSRILDEQLETKKGQH